MKTRKRRKARITATTATVTAVGDIVIKRKRAAGLFLLAGLLCLCSIMPVQAQCVAKNEAFQSGEHVMYDLYFNWKFIWKKVGLASLTTMLLLTASSRPTVSIFFLWAARKRIFSLKCAIR